MQTFPSLSRLNVTDVINLQEQRSRSRFLQGSPYTAAVHFGFCV